MPLEIRELIIKVTVKEDQFKNDEQLDMKLRDLKKEVIKECIDKISARMELLNER